MKYDCIVVGCGISGSTIAERLANNGKKVLIIEERNHIGGNAYDYYDENGILIHKYGPHLFHTNYDEVYNYITQFGKWFKYEHRVLGKVNNILVPVPFNLTSIEKSFDKEKATLLKNKLIDEYGKEKKVPILELKKSDEKEINELANYIYENVFLYYTMKQWGQTPDEIDPNVTNRVPVFVSYDDRYFQDKYQIMPVLGYTNIIKNMTSNKNITIKLNTNIMDLIEIKNNNIYFEGEKYDNPVIFTGLIDELFNYKYGKLSYRSLDFELTTINKKEFQPVGTVNYPTKEDLFTRITEFKHMTMEKSNINKTVIMKEFPKDYKDENDIPCYPINNETNGSLYNKYLEESNKISNLYLLGRLAKYKYFNMDLVIKDALELYESMR